MPQPIHPLPVNPTTGQQPLAMLRNAVSGPPPATSAGGGGVSREILKVLQDVAWSDDEDDPDCMVCAEPLDLSDQNFKPCQCGMQICQFCYNKLLHDDPRCPGCRRPYDASAVVFQPVDFEEVRRVKEKKTKRAKIIKQLSAMGRRHLLGTRIVMKNSVYVVGMRIPGPGGDESTSILRSNEYFGQYGKVAKIYLRDRTALSSTAVPSLSSDSSDPSSSATSTGIYIIYVRREDAARAIAALDGIPAPQGPPGQILRASYGATRYCDAFLRGVKCDNLNCQNLHEWGGEGDCFTKNDLHTALTRPAEYDARQKQATILAAPPPLSQKSLWPKPSAEEVDSTALPKTANWGTRPLSSTATATTSASGRPGSSSSTSSSTTRMAPVGAARPAKVVSNLIPLGSNRTSTSAQQPTAMTPSHAAAFPLPTPSPVFVHPVKEKKEKKASGGTAMTRGRSGSSTISSNAPGPGGLSSAQTSPKKKMTPLAKLDASVGNSAVAMRGSGSGASAGGQVSQRMTASPEIESPLQLEPSSKPQPLSAPESQSQSAVPPGIAPPPGLGESSTSRPGGESSNSSSQPQTISPPLSSSLQSPHQSLPYQTEYPIHSPFPDFEDIFLMDKMNDFAFSLSLDDDELAARLAESGGYEPSPFDPMFEQLPKLGIALAALVAVPTAAGALGGIGNGGMIGGVEIGNTETNAVVYNGPFSPFAHSEPGSSGSSDDPSGSGEASGGGSGLGGSNSTIMHLSNGMDGLGLSQHLPFQQQQQQQLHLGLNGLHGFNSHMHEQHPHSLGGDDGASGSESGMMMVNGHGSMNGHETGRASRTTSRFEFARRSSLASSTGTGTARGQSPFRLASKEDWRLSQLQQLQLSPTVSPQPQPHAQPHPPLSAQQQQLANVLGGSTSNYSPLQQQQQRPRQLQPQQTGPPPGFHSHDLVSLNHNLNHNHVIGGGVLHGTSFEDSTSNSNSTVGNGAGLPPPPGFDWDYANYRQQQQHSGSSGMNGVGVGQPLTQQQQQQLMQLQGLSDGRSASPSFSVGVGGGGGNYFSQPQQSQSGRKAAEIYGGVGGYRRY